MTVLNMAAGDIYQFQFDFDILIEFRGSVYEQ